MERVLPIFSLKIALVRKRVSQRQLAFGIGVHENLVSKIINGFERPTPEIKQKISQYLKLSESELFL